LVVVGIVLLAALGTAVVVIELDVLHAKVADLIPAGTGKEAQVVICEDGIAADRAEAVVFIRVSFPGHIRSRRGAGCNDGSKRTGRGRRG
jgi:hypothetical protein